jgi:hypothetical protein
VVGEGDVRGVHEVFDEEVEGVGEVAGDEGRGVGKERNHLLGQHRVVRGLLSHQRDKGRHGECAAERERVPETEAGEGEGDRGSWREENWRTIQMEWRQGGSEGINA